MIVSSSYSNVKMYNNVYMCAAVLCGRISRSSYNLSKPFYEFLFLIEVKDIREASLHSDKTQQICDWILEN